MADIFNMADTWNAGGTTFTAIKMDVTDTASASASVLMNLLVGGVSRFTVGKDGGLTVRNSAGNGIFAAGPTQASFDIAAGHTLAWWSSTSFAAGSRDLILAREAANTLAQRNGANAQTLRWYHTYTDASNYQRGALKTAAGYVEIAAETAGTGADDLDVLLTPAGAGNVRFGSHSAIGVESVSGYITIKDAGGTTRKIAVVS